MVKSYLAIALRHLTTQKLYSAINVFGLAVGLACFILIALYVRYELSYDEQWTNAERIYRVSREYLARDGARPRVPASANAPIAPALVAEFAEIEAAARIFGGRSEQAGRVFGARSLLGRDDVAFFEDRLRFADSDVLGIFDFEWLQGEPAAALAQPSSIVLTARLARKYFGGDDPIGRTLTFNGSVPLDVTGVIADLPENTHLSIDALVSLSTLAQQRPQMLENWNASTDFHTYIRLREGADIAAVEARTAEFLDRHIENGSSFSTLRFMNVADIHLRSNRDEEWRAPGNIVTVYSFAVIALAVLLIACVNFMNLSTARASARAREVAVRKTMGATKAQMVGQFLGESLLFSAVAAVLAIALVELALPAFRAFIGAPLPFDYFANPTLVFALLGLIVGVGVVAGSYPAFYLAAFRPAKVLKGEVTRGSAGAALRNALVVFQFAIAIALLIGTAVVYQQTQFARNIDLGFQKDQIVVLTGVAALDSQWPAFKEELLAHPGVESVTASHFTPFSTDDNSLALRAPGTLSATRIQYVHVDYGFFETYGIEVVAGRSFAPEFQGDAIVPPNADAPVGRGAIVLNESAANLLGFAPDAAAGQRVDIGLSEDFSARVESTVVGVVEDTHFESVEAAVRPLVFAYLPQVPNVASIRVTAAGLPAALAHIDATWREFRPDQPVTRHFLDQDFQALYRAQERQSWMFAAFSLLAVFVACLGLLGLASFTTEQRTKEIGVRKVMGGSVVDIVRLFSGEFSKLVLLANVVAWPVVYLLMQRWLANFAYRIDLSLLIFAGGALAAFAVALLTVGMIAARAAATNPIHALRYE